MAEESSQEKTEQATEKRMKEVRSKGQLQKSQDMTAWVGVGAAAATMPMVLSRASAAATDHVFTITTIIANPEPGRAVQALFDAGHSALATLAPMFIAVVICVVLAAAVQGGVHLKKLEAKTQQFNLVAGIKQTFGLQSLWNGAKALLKTVVIGAVLYAVVIQFLPLLLTAGGLPVAELLATAAKGIATLLQWAIAAGIALALADVLVVMKRNRKKTRMSKKEVKDEHKNTDGDPLIKSQRRSRQLAMSRNRMIAEVADADVVIVNPTHVAIALRYQAGISAPRVVAKGADHLATRIRAEASAHDVPLVANIPLAWTLHEQCELGQVIPTDLYTDVARVLAFVQRLKQRGSATARVHHMPGQAA